MTYQPPALAVRIRLYLTLILQVLPFIVLIVISAGNFRLNILFVMSPFLVAIIGLVMELASRPRGRALTLIGLGVQALAVIGFLVLASIKTEDMWTNLKGEDALTMLVLLIPLYLLIWNYYSGRGHLSKPVAT